MRVTRIGFVALACLSFGGAFAFVACGDDSTAKVSGDAAADSNEGSVGAEGSTDAGPDVITLVGDPCGDRSGLQAGSSWPMVGGCPKRGGVTGTAGPATTTIRFRTQLPVAGTSPVVDANGNLEIATSDGRLLTIDLAGNVADAGTSPSADAGADANADASADAAADAGGSADAGGDASVEGGASTLTGTSLAIGSDGQLIYGESDQNEYSFYPTKIGSSWSRALGSVPLASPVVSPAFSVYVNNTSGSLFALALDTGAVQWTAQTHDTLGTSAPAIGDDQTVYIGSSDKHVYAFTKAGAPRWQFATSDAVAATPAVSLDGRVIVADVSGTVYAIDPATGIEKWHASVGSPVHVGCAVGLDGTAFCSSDDGKVHALDLGGMPVYVFTTLGKTTAPIVDPNGVVYVGSEDSHLYAIAPSGKLRFAVSVFGPVRAQPAMGPDGAIYVTTDTELVGIGP